MHPDTQEAISLYMYDRDAIWIGDSIVERQNIIGQRAETLDISAIGIGGLAEDNKTISAGAHLALHVIDEKKTVGYVGQL